MPVDLLDSLAFAVSRVPKVGSAKLQWQPPTKDGTIQWLRRICRLARDAPLMEEAQLQSRALALAAARGSS